MTPLKKVIQHFNNNELQEANQCIVPLLEQNPVNPELWHLYGIIAARQKYNHLAINSLKKACALLPDNGNYLFNLANVYRQARMIDLAIENYQNALKYTANKRPVFINYGIALKEKGLYDQALSIFLEILKTQVDDLQAYLNIGNVFTEMGQYTSAISFYEKVLQVQPKNDEAHRNKASLLLTQGNLKAGFDTYEWRWAKNEKYLQRNKKLSLWDGSDLSDKHIFVWGEQSAGDEIIFASVLPELIQKSRQVSIECTPTLLSIFMRSFPQADIIPEKPGIADEPLLFADAHFQSPTGRLMRYLRRSFDQFPQESYLKADSIKVKELNAKYYATDKNMKVGISWTSFPDSYHWPKLEQWEPILSIPDIQFFNLQYGDCSAEIEQMENKLNIKIINDPDIDPQKNLDDHAAQIQVMDLVICIGNPTAQLAGALGQSVWVLLPFSSDWYWFTNREDSPWYPCMRLFRQARLKDWEHVMITVSNALRNR